MRSTILVSAFLASTLSTPIAAALAHSPLFPEENQGLASAHEIGNPAKSWAIYSRLHDGDAAYYYKFTIGEGERIQASLIVPDSPSRSGFLPSFALLGPGLTDRDSVPTYVAVPEGYGVMVVEGADPTEAVYEPFTPGWFYEVGTLMINAPSDGEYYLTVFNPEAEGDGHDHIHHAKAYAIVVGYVEEFTALELILIPYRVQGVYRWEGQSLVNIFLPHFSVIVIGGIALYRRHRLRKDSGSLSGLLAVLGGLACIATAAGAVYQMLLSFRYTGISGEAAITLVAVSLSLMVGIVAWRLARGRGSTLTVSKRVGLVAVGVTALFAWAGLYVGPALLFAAALMPSSVSK